MINDWFHKKSFPLELLEELKSYVLPQLENVQWTECRPNQAPGSVWCLLPLTETLHKKIESAVQYKIYPDFYIWNYLEVKTLKIHKDTNEPGAARHIAGVIPLVGDFEAQIYDDENFHKPKDVCRYGPGELLFLNNTKYFHGGQVLSDVRISMHFYFDFFNTNNESLEVLLQKNKLP